MRLLNNQKSLFSAFLISLLMTFLSGCDSSSDDDNDVTPSNKASISIPVTLDGMQNGKTTSASGTASLLLNTGTGALSGSVTVTGLEVGNNITGAHIHIGNPGASGALIVTLEADSGASPATKWNVPENTMLTTNLDTFLAGGTYINVHTDNNASGEIRGQVLPENYSLTVTTLSGDQQVPAAVISTMSATGYLMMNTSTGSLYARVKASDGNNIASVHIHSGFAGTGGVLLETLTKDTTDNTVYEIFKTTASDKLADFVADYNAGKLYFNVHTTTNASGELRGQILSNNIEMVRTTLDSSQITPDTQSDATAIAYLTIDKFSGTVVSNIRTSGITGTLAHIHEGAVNATGNAVLSFTKNTTDENLWEATGTFTAAQITKLDADGLYYNVHSNAFSSGEIRGQIEP